MMHVKPVRPMARPAMLINEENLFLIKYRHAIIISEIMFIGSALGFCIGYKLHARKAIIAIVPNL